VYLNNYDGTLFAAAPIPENYDQGVVKCADSSRGFALKLVDPHGKSAWVGLVFVERYDSFDFIAALQDFAKNRDMELNPAKYAEENKPTHNFALKKGEKISFNVGDSSKPKTTTGTSGGAFKLAPPPGSFGLTPPPGGNNMGFPGTQTQTQPKPSGTTSGGFDSFGGFGTTSNKPTTTANNDPFGNFGGFGGFGGSTQTQTTQSSGSNGFDLLGDINFGGSTGNSGNSNSGSGQQFGQNTGSGNNQGSNNLLDLM